MRKPAARLIRPSACVCGHGIRARLKVRAIAVFVEGLDLAGLGFAGVDPEAIGRPGYHPSVLLKFYTYGLFQSGQSSRGLEREAGRDIEVTWLVGRPIPDHKTMADFCKDSGAAIPKVCAQFVALCREQEPERTCESYDCPGAQPLRRGD
jgi:transposase